MLYAWLSSLVGLFAPNGVACRKAGLVASFLSAKAKVRRIEEVMGSAGGWGKRTG